MATEQFMPQYVNWNNLEEVWAQIVHNFIAAAPAAKGDMIYWSGVPMAGVNANPAASVAHLSVPAQADQSKSMLGVANGIPAWKVVTLDKTEATSKLTIGISLGGASVSSVDILEATASRAGVITTLEQTIKGDKHLQGNFDATGGVAANGITDLSQASGGGGGGTVANVDFTQDVPYQQTGVYNPDDGTIHLPRYKWGNIQDKPIVTTGSTNGTISYGGVDVAVYGLQALAYKASLTASDIPTIAISQVSGLQTALNNKLETSLKGAANGLAELDASQKIKLAQIPDVVLGQLVFGGTVNASGVATLSANAKTKTGITSNTVTLSNSAGTSSSYGWVRFEGCFFIMDADSSFASLDLKVGDWLLSTGTAWKKVDNTDAVTGVKGDNESSYRIGNVNITKANIGLGNVENTALSTWAGTQNITTLGTITTGVWHGTKIANDYLANKTIYINGTLFTLGDSASDNKVTSVWGTARDITISDNDGTNTQKTQSINGGSNFTLKLPSTIKATITGNASSATKLQNSRNIWGQAFDGTAEVSGNMSSVGNIAFNAGDHNIGSLLYFDMTNGRIGIGMSAPLEKLGVQGNMYATGGVAAYGISDLSQSGGGGGGLSGTILRDWSQYDGSAEANQILSSYLGIEQFRMSGQNFQFMRNKTWTTGFTLAEGNVPDLAIGKITGVQSLTIKGGTTSVGTYSPSSALELSIVAGTNISVTPDATNHKITIANTYSLPTASSSTKGGIKVGSGLTISNEVLSVSGVTNDMLSGSIANDKLVNSKVTIAGTDVSLGGSITAAQLQTNLGLGGAAYKAADYYVNSISWDSTNKKLAWSKGGTAQSAITIGYATDADTVDGHHASEFVGALGTSGNYLTWTKIGGTAQNITVPYATNAGTLGGVAKEGLFTLLANDNKQLSATIGGVNKKLTLDYAKKSTILETEPFPNQEFIFRNSPKTIGADSLRIDKFLGNTVVWNNQVPGEFTDETMYAHYKATLSLSNNIATITPSGQYGQISMGLPIIVGHKYFIHSSIKGTSGRTLMYKLGNSIQSITITNIFANYSKIAGPSDVSDNAFVIYDGAASGWQPFQVKNLFVIDLTLFFNGNIPDGLTTETFERDYGYLLTNPNKQRGKLINNSAEGLETVGFNKFDENTWVLGKWITGSGTISDEYSDRRATLNYTPCLSNTDYYLYTNLEGNYAFWISWYDINKNHLRQDSNKPNQIVKSPIGAAFFRVATPGSSGYLYCINLSDPAKNGTYEPYKRNVLDLHLEEFKVKDSQGNIITITGGLKQAGSVRDEIVGGKYIRRVGSVDLGSILWEYYDGRFSAIVLPTPLYRGTTSASTSNITLATGKYTVGSVYNIYDKVNYKISIGLAGSSAPGGNYIYVIDNDYSSAQTFKNSLLNVYLNYELAQYIEYELVDPIPMAMPAGTTERRLPEDTSDSVLAPFACDMTYGTNPGDILTDMIGLDKKLDYNLSRMNIAHYKSSQDGVIDSHLIALREGQQMYFKFNASTQGKFELAMASDGDDTNLQEFSFGTMTAAQIQAICHL